MKIFGNINTVAALLTLLFLTLMVYLVSGIATAWNDCPYGFENNPYPGLCSRYIDQNRDNICDRSQSNPSQSSSGSTGDCDDCSGNCNNSPYPSTIQGSSGSQAAISVPLQENQNFLTLLGTFGIVVVGLTITRYAAKWRKIPSKKPRLFWNIFLLVFFIFSAITGIVLILFVTFPSLKNINLDFLQWHTVTSFLFMWISLYHFVIHSKYYKRGLKKLFTPKEK